MSLRQDADKIISDALEAAQPETALISAPERSLYGHPHQETLDRLEEAGAVIFATKDCGAVTLYEKKGRILIKQWKRNPG